MRGNVIGGYTAEGQPLGTKNRGFHRYGPQMSSYGRPAPSRAAAPKSPDYQLIQIPGTNQYRVYKDKPPGKSKSPKDSKPPVGNKDHQGKADRTEARIQSPDEQAADTAFGVISKFAPAIDPSSKHLRGQAAEFAASYKRHQQAGKLADTALGVVSKFAPAVDPTSKQLRGLARKFAGSYKPPQKNNDGSPAQKLADTALGVLGKFAPGVDPASKDLRGIATNLATSFIKRQKEKTTPRINKLTGLPFGFEPGDTDPATEIADKIPGAGGLMRGFRALAPKLIVSAAKSPRINKLTGLPFGTGPGDPAYERAKKKKAGPVT